ncbi:MAG: hypothetical protein AAF329_06055 [Cyanobacteria bacterium P01_A01_bin.17]
MAASSFSLVTLVLDIGTKSQNLNQQDNNLSKQIEEVEDAINDLRGLEEYLEETKNKIIITQQSKDEIEDEYRKAQELEKLTTQQIDAISLAINKRTFRDIAKDYVLGFILGIGSSIVASYIFNFLTKNRQAGKAIQEND